MPSKFIVVEEDGYVKVKRGQETICAGVAVTDGPGLRSLRQIAFVKDEYRKNNRTRIAAMKALKDAGWK